mmetsp:Transcript_40459/g.104715  ORF Transcript_40459/g.104715 Transcript_40459/m.104715 type:complete len:149 (-) Transcript_40459:42-488(-)
MPTVGEQDPDGVSVMESTVPQQRLRAPRWDRLHLGLTEVSAIELGICVPTQTLKQCLDRRVSAPVADEEMESIGPPKPLQPSAFPPIVERGSAHPSRSHYEYFARKCPLTNASSRATNQHRAKMGRRMADALVGVMPMESGHDDGDIT